MNFTNSINNLSPLLPQIIFSDKSISISNIQPANNTLLKEGVFIVISDALQKPPHLSLLVDGKIFSLNVKGPQLDFSSEKYIKWLKIKHIPALLIQLNNFNLNSENQSRYITAQRSILKFPKVEAGIITCLSPIKNFCAETFQIDVSKVDSIFELLPILFKQKHIVACYHYNMEKHLLNQSFELEKYTVQDIYESICRYQVSEVIAN